MGLNDYKGILLDLDNTVYDYKAAHEPALGKALEVISAHAGAKKEVVWQAYLEARREINANLAGTAASHNRLLYFQKTLELLTLSDCSYALSAYEIYWHTFLDLMELRNGVAAFLDSLGMKRLCWVTDLTAHIQFRKINKLNLFRHGSSLVTSEEAGHEKPHPYIFLLALRKLNLSAEKCCMIGDDLARDICGAAAVGIRGYWFNSTTVTEQLPQGAEDFCSFCDLTSEFERTG